MIKQRYDCALCCRMKDESGLCLYHCLYRTQIDANLVHVSPHRRLGSSFGCDLCKTLEFHHRLLDAGPRTHQLRSPAMLVYLGFHVQNPRPYQTMKKFFVSWTFHLHSNTFDGTCQVPMESHLSMLLDIIFHFKKHRCIKYTDYVAFFRLNSGSNVWNIGRHINSSPGVSYNLGTDKRSQWSFPLVPFSMPLHASSIFPFTWPWK